jgi:endoglucanase
VPQVVLYAVPHRDCGSYSAGGLDARSYRAWVREVAAGLRGGRSVVVVEPDALGLLDCLLGAARSERLALLRDALAVLRAAGATAYLGRRQRLLAPTGGHGGPTAVRPGSAQPAA